MENSSHGLLFRPVVGLSGSPDLQDSILTVRGKVMELGRLAEAAAPNGRDYYPQGDGAIGAAIKERAGVARGVAALADQLLLLADMDAGVRPVDTSGFAEAALSFGDSPVMRPTVHLNGTSASELKSSCVAVFRKADEVEESLRSIMPNGRDYLPEDLESARRQHIARMAFVKKVAGYYLQLAVPKR